MTTIAASVTGRALLSSLRTTTEATATTQEATDVSAITMTTNTGVSRQQIINAFLADLAVYSEQYDELLKEGVKIDTIPAQNVLKSSLPLLLKTDSGSKNVSDIWDVPVNTDPGWDWGIDPEPKEPPIDWVVPLDGNMDKDGDGIFDLDADGDGKVDDYVDYSQYAWDTKDHGGIPQSDWEIYANVTTELAGLKTNYMDVYTDLANQSVEFLDAVNGFKTRMVNYITSGTGDDKDKIYIDVAGVNDELNTIINSWGKYVTVPITDEKGNVTGQETIPNTNEINPLPLDDGTPATPPSSGPVAIRGLDLAGVDYWAVQLDMEDQLVVDKEVTAGKDGKMGTEETDKDNVIVYNSITVAPDTPEKSNQLYLVAENDGTYTLYVYPDIQPIVEARNTTLSIDDNDFKYIEPKDRSDKYSSITSNEQLQEMLKKDDSPTRSGSVSGLTRYDSKGNLVNNDSNTGIYVYPTTDDNHGDGTGGFPHTKYVTGDSDYNYAGDKEHSHYALTPDYPLDKVSDDDWNDAPDGCSYYQLKGENDEDSTIVIPDDMIVKKGSDYYVKETVVICDSTTNIDDSGDWDGDAYCTTLNEYANYFYPPDITIDDDDVDIHHIEVSTSVFNEWENSMNTMSSTVESDSQIMSEKLNQANTIYNNLTKVLSSTIEALLETQKEFLK